MAIHVNPELEAQWRQRIQDGDGADALPLPAVDTIVIRDDGTPSISLIAPHVLPGFDEIFVAVADMPEEERRVLTDLLRVLSERSKVPGALVRVQHLGGSDYELFGSDSADGVRLSELPLNESYWVLRILGFIAELGQHFPDERASTPKLVQT